MPDDLIPAHRTYAHVDPSADEGDGLNLAWTRDERPCLALDVGAIVTEELSAVDRYLVRDPYGDDTLDVPAWRGKATCGAGVVALIHALARLGPSRIVTDVYPDFPYYASRGQPAGTRPVWFLERPSLQHDAFADLAALDRLCDDAARAGADVLVDESNANYCPPAYSATTLATSRDNLAVLRGWAKAYGLGGLRLGVCVASTALTARIRELVPPLSAASLSLRVGARLLAAGDLTAPLRARIAAHKPEAVRLFAGDATAASEHLPYILSLTRRDTATITGKLHPIYVAKTGSVHHLRRFSVPLAPDRMARLRKLAGSAEGARPA